MSTPFQNRLVGTIIVAAAAVIFLPDILDGKSGPSQAQFEKMPQQTLYKQASNVEEFPQQKIIHLTSPELSDEKPVDVEQTASIDSANDESTQQKQQSSELKNTSTQASNSEPQTFKKRKAPVTVTLDEQPVVDEQEQLKKAWVIQLGSFKHKANVDNLMKKLKKQGYIAYTRPIATKHGELIKVFVGPELDRNALVAQQKDLKKLTGSSGKLVQYHPAKS